jgi:hypothetical protein
MAFMTMQKPLPPQPEMPNKPSKPRSEMPDRSPKPTPEVQDPSRAYQPEVHEIEQRPNEPFQKPEIEIPGPNLPTPENPEGRDQGYRPLGS